MFKQRFILIFNRIAKLKAGQNKKLTISSVNDIGTYIEIEKKCHSTYLKKKTLKVPT